MTVYIFCFIGNGIAGNAVRRYHALLVTLLFLLINS